MVAPPWITPEWPAHPRVRAASTTRVGGYSQPPFASLNLSDYVGDDPTAVARNRAWLRTALDLTSDPRWLRQCHGTAVCDLDRYAAAAPPDADASVATKPGCVCAVLTADCLPVLLCNLAGTRVAAVHAGWRGLAAGVIEAAIKHFDDPGEQLLAWLGPAIGPAKFEVGSEVREEFVRRHAESARAFRAGAAGQWFADLYELARIRLRHSGVDRIYGGGSCTYSEADRFFSYRRDTTSGRMASLIWITP